MNNSRLSLIQNWPELMQRANWIAKSLAKHTGVSVRTLHRHILQKTGNNTKTWLAEQRQRRALELLRAGFSIKETAITLGYKQPTNFTRQYKKHWGRLPSQPVDNPTSAQNVRK